jgi:hypothetical protein
MQIKENMNFAFMLNSQSKRTPSVDGVYTPFFEIVHRTEPGGGTRIPVV